MRIADIRTLIEQPPVYDRYELTFAPLPAFASHGVSRIGENAIGIILATVAQPTSVLLLRYTIVYYITEYDRRDYDIRWVRLVYYFDEFHVY